MENIIQENEDEIEIMDNRFCYNNHFQNLGLDFIYNKLKISPCPLLDIAFQDIKINTPGEDWQLLLDKNKLENEQIIQKT